MLRLSVVEKKEAVKMCVKVSTSSFSVRMRFCIPYFVPDTQNFVVKKHKDGVE